MQEPNQAFERVSLRLFGVLLEVLLKEAGVDSSLFGQQVKRQVGSQGRGAVALSLDVGASERVLLTVLPGTAEVIADKLSEIGLPDAQIDEQLSRTIRRAEVKGLVRRDHMSPDLLMITEVGQLVLDQVIESAATNVPFTQRGASL